MHELYEQIISHGRAIWRKRWYAISIAWAFAIIGWIVVYMLPNRYEATARVYVDTQSVLKPLLSGLTVQPNVDQQVTMMTRTLLSRPNLEKVVRTADLDLSVNDPKARDRLIDDLAREVKLDGGRDNLYTISYQNKDPQVAKRVVQSLLTIFVEGSLGNKRKDTDAAMRFIDQQLQAYAQKLNVAEDALKAFKRAHLGSVGNSGNSYFERLTAASNDLSQARLALSEVENRRDALKRQLAGEEPVMISDADTAGSDPEIDARIQALERNLDVLRLQYTEQHPDITSTKRIIAQLKEQKKQDAKTKDKTPGKSAGQSAVYQQLSVAQAEADADAASLSARVAEYQRRYDALRASADAQPQVDVDYEQLVRDVDINKRNYEALLARRQTALITGEMDAKTDVVDFRVVDPPRVPATPAAPNRPLLVSLVFLAGLMLGIAVAFILSQIRRTVDDRKSLREMTGLPVLGNVSMVWTDAQKERNRRGIIGYMASFLGLVGAYSAVLLLTLFAVRG